MLLLTAAGKWARGGWAGSDADERRVKEDTQAGVVAAATVVAAAAVLLLLVVMAAMAPQHSAALCSLLHGFLQNTTNSTNRLGDLTSYHTHHANAQDDGLDRPNPITPAPWPLH